MNGGTGLYCGEQDMFCFLIDPAGWTEIDGEAFAPGFFLWNSEVGRRSLGIQTFWFQAVCQNHIVWDAVEVADFTRKHTANVHESLGEIRRIIEALVARRDERRDGFAKVIAKAMKEQLGADADDALKALLKNGISRGTAKQALAIAERQGRFTIFALVDALTRIAGEIHARRRPHGSGYQGECVARPGGLIVPIWLEALSPWLSNKPVHEIRLGRIKAAIWENETQNGTRHNVTVSRLYKDGEQWKDTQSFGRDDLPLLAKVIDRAHSWIFEESQDAA